MKGPLKERTQRPSLSKALVEGSRISARAGDFRVGRRLGGSEGRLQGTSASLISGDRSRQPAHGASICVGEVQRVCAVRRSVIAAEGNYLPIGRERRIPQRQRALGAKQLTVTAPIRPDQAERVAALVGDDPRRRPRGHLRSGRHQRGRNACSHRGGRYRDDDDQPHHCDEMRGPRRHHLKLRLPTRRGSHRGALLNTRAAHSARGRTVSRYLYDARLGRCAAREAESHGCAVGCWPDARRRRAVPARVRRPSRGRACQARQGFQRQEVIELAAGIRRIIVDGELTPPTATKH